VITEAGLYHNYVLSGVLRDESKMVPSAVE